MKETQLAKVYVLQHVTYSLVSNAKSVPHISRVPPGCASPLHFSMDHDTVPAQVTEAEHSRECTDPFGDIRAACVQGDLAKVHKLYSSWFARQEPDPRTGLVGRQGITNAAWAAAVSGHWACLNYFLSQGAELVDHVIRAGVESKSTAVLEGMLTRGWDINKPEMYCEPPYLAYCAPDPNQDDMG